MSEKLNDLDYCYASWELLKALEQNSYSRNEYIRKFKVKISEQQALVIGLLSLILPLGIWVYLFLSDGFQELLSLRRDFSKFGTDLLGLLMVSGFLFLIVYMLLHTLWKSDRLYFVKKITEKRLRNQLMEDLKSTNEKAESIITQELFEEERIPNRFLCSEMLPLLIRYFENGQATTMKEAVFYLELELLNTGHYENLIPQVTLLQREKSYLVNEREDFEKKVKGGKEL